MIGRRERLALWGGGLIVFAFGAVIHWRYRYFVNADAVQYLDVARQLYAGNWAAAANPVWSPVFPLLIAAAMLPAIDRPDVWHTAAQVVNVFAEIVVLACLARFVVTAIARRDPAASMPTRHVIWIGWAAAFLFLHYAATSRAMTPDLMVCACVLAMATALLTPPAERTATWAVRFGALLALGYHVKAILFPLSALAAGGLLLASALRKQMRAALIASATWLILIAPLAAAVSARAGHVTFGDSGRLVYDWWVNRGPFFPAGSPGRDGSAMTQVCSAPIGYHWTFPDAVTYAPFYEPSFWRETYKVPLSIGAQLRSVPRIASELGQALFPVLGLVVPAALLIAAGWRGAARGRAFAPVVLLSLALIAAYLPVHIELRFITASLMLLTVSWAASIAGPLSPASRHVAIAAWLGAVLIVGPLTAGSLRHAYLAIAGTPRDEAQIHRAAAELPAFGVPAGSRVAVIGNDLQVAWAQLAGLQIVAEVPSDRVSGTLSPQMAQALAACLHAPDRPVDAIISKLPLSSPVAGWQLAPSSGLTILKP